MTNKYSECTPGRSVRNMQGHNYQERLCKLGLYSQQRRRDHYRAVYIWKILECLVPDPAVHKMEASFSERSGRKCKRRCLTMQARGRIKSLQFSSLGQDGPRIFNSLPKAVRCITNCSDKKFKTGIDKFLMTLPDEPALPVPGYAANCRAESNSITDQVVLIARDARSNRSGGSPRLRS